MAENYILLERIELNADTSSVTFNNIPQSGYTDLKIVASSRTSRTSDTDAIKIRFNGSSSSYTNKVLYASGSGVASFSGSTDSIGNAYTASNYLATGLFGSQEFYIPNYTGSSYKSVSVDSVEEANTTYAEMDIIAGLWSNTAAITSIEILPNVGGSLIQYSTFSLYGLAALGTTPSIAPKASGGNIQTDGTYWYHTFLTSGTFTPATNLTCDALVVAGGGGGGAGQGGGGGAGGLLGFTSQAFANATSYTVTVGAGGAGGTRSTVSNGLRGTTGNDSQLGALTLVKGGGYGGNYDNSGPGGAGGSGGGAGGTNTAPASGGSATSGQGNNGGAITTYAAPYYGGSGGGAGTAGGTGGNLTPTAGAGSSAYSSWGLATTTGQNVSGTVYYAGGGGGAGEASTVSGGNGGGASSGTTGNNGTTNTGGGGGATTYNSSLTSAGAGGSGIVIIRYAMA